MTLDLEFLDRTPPEGARVLALALLADAADAAARIGGDEEALHDFRVALRRLRSTLRSWRPALGEVLRKKDERRLRKIARATNEARDAEVLLAWLAEAQEELAGSHRPAAAWLAARTEQHRRHCSDRLRDGSAERLRRLAGRMARRVAGGTGRGKAGETFGGALASLVRAQARLLRDALLRVASAEDVAHAHRARIEGKRLRYLLEPLRGTPTVDSSGAVRALKGLQDTLGDLHDAHAAAAAISCARVEAAAERVRAPGPTEAGPGLRPGLLALERAAGKRARTLFERLDAEVLAGKGVSVLDPVYAVVTALEERCAAGTGDPPAARRRFLLTQLPDTARWGASTEIEKGWLPQDQPRECYGVARSERGESFFRSLSTGSAAGGAQTTEQVPGAVFESFWPLTEGRRIHKRCHVTPGEPGWRFDDYLDRQLALAVAEPGNDGPPPPWLDGYVVREVTGERGYHDDVLARRPRRAPRAQPGEPGASAPMPETAPQSASDDAPAGSP